MTYKLVILFLVISTILSAVSNKSNAGKEIKAETQIKYRFGSQQLKSNSNSMLILNQYIEPKVKCIEKDILTTKAGDIDQLSSFVIINNGNYNDTFEIFFPKNKDFINQRVFIDNGDKEFSIEDDKEINTISLKRDKENIIFILSDIPVNSTWENANSIINVKSIFGGSGIPWTSHNLNNENFKAIDGEKGGVDSASCKYYLDNLKLHIGKESISYGKEIYKGTKIKYTLTVTVSGRGLFKNVLIREKMPKGGSFVPNTVKIDGKKVNDKDVFKNNKVKLSFKNMSKEDKHIISFDVIVVK